MQRQPVAGVATPVPSEGMIQLELPALNQATGLRQALSWMLEEAEGSEWTRRMHADHARYLLKYFGDRPVQAIGYVAIREYYREEKRRGISKETIRKRVGTLRMALREAVAHGVIEHLPEEPVIRSDTRRKEGFWTLTEWEAAHLACDDEEFQTWVACNWWMGSRAADLDRLRWQDIDFVKGTWIRRSSKTGVKPAELPLPNRLLEILRERHERVQPHPRDLVTGQRMGHPNRALRALARRAGIPEISPSEAGRHSCETFLEESGVSKAMQLQWLGLTSEKMLKHYRHVTPATVDGSMELVNARTASS